MDQIINMIAPWAIGLIMGSLVKTVIPNMWNGLMIKLRKDLKEKAAIYLKDPEWKDIVSKIVIKVQKDFAKEANEVKLLKAVDALCKFSPIPDNLERPIYEEMVRLVIEEVKKDIEL